MERESMLKTIIQKAKHVVVMTGAGISVPSGIPDFRSATGLYQEKGYSVTPETILSHTFFHAHTQDFYDYYRSKLLYPNALPNVAHSTLAKLEESGKVKAIITQNIDGLHQIAGSKNVIELHGSIKRNYCLKCKKSYDLDFMLEGKGIPTCICGGIVKPDVVLYEEALPMDALLKAIEELEQADVLLVVGTSLLVNPAASLVHYFKGKEFIIINRSATPYDHLATLLIRTPLEKVLTNDLFE